MSKTTEKPSVAICCGPNLGVKDRLCGQVALGQTAREATEALRDNHILWCHQGEAVPTEVAPAQIAALILNPPQYFDQ